VHRLMVKRYEETLTRLIRWSAFHHSLELIHGGGHDDDGIYADHLLLLRQ
jgi:hypothetical protein